MPGATCTDTHAPVTDYHGYRVFLNLERYPVRSGVGPLVKSRAVLHHLLVSQRGRCPVDESFDCRCVVRGRGACLNRGSRGLGCATGNGDGR